MFTLKAKDSRKFIENGVGILDGPVERLVIKEKWGIDRQSHDLQRNL